jgi:hypothetical protein
MLLLLSLGCLQLLDLHTHGPEHSRIDVHDRVFLSLLALHRQSLDLLLLQDVLLPYLLESLLGVQDLFIEFTVKLLSLLELLFNFT